MENKTCINCQYYEQTNVVNLDSGWCTHDEYWGKVDHGDSCEYFEVSNQEKD